VFMSDHDKGLLETDTVFGERCLCIYCCKHLEDNLKDQFGTKADLPVLFWKTACARLSSSFEHHIAKIVLINPAAAE
jgi:hypothetical protein